MAKRALSNLVSRGIAHSFESRVISMQHFGQSLKYSTKISGDSDTHEDFRSTNKLEGSGISVQDVVQQDVKINPVMIYMKGVPDAPRCGFSALAIKVLQQYRVPISSRNILEDPVLKEGVKAFRLSLLLMGYRINS
ncbi:monothiol glutaredoxin-S15, mitochondrial-like [Dendrobium catenatum]|uniref:monothiol glutaredoxin-S15, mitochondrial-like n=1 Tax=Dendrobium catenatum TaxID=906689 RepID=UPI0010A07FBE|nr:monothiol glutaredoxin-S15, mitochondrial-like [Dendrobium catenatum]